MAKDGSYEEAHLDRDEISTLLSMVQSDYEYGKQLRTIPNQNWRVIFNIHYDAVRELCDILLRFKQQKISNHQGLFAFIILYFPDIECSWEFFEEIRTIRNHNKYLGTDISIDMWKKTQLEIDLTVSTLLKEIKKHLSR